MKKHLLTLLSLTAGISAFAIDFEVDGIKYTITDSEAKTCETKQGITTLEMGFIEWYEPGNPVSGDIVIPSAVEYEGETYSVTSVGKLSFVDCQGLTSITLPEGLQQVGDMAFYYCQSLKSAVMPSTVAKVGVEAFNDCDALEYVATPSIESWCNISFRDYIGNPLYHAGHLMIDGAEVTDVAIPSSITKVGANVFAGFTGLKSLYIGDNVTAIGSHAFYACNGLTDVYVGGGVKTSEQNAFYACNAVETVSIDSVEDWCVINFANASANPLSHGAKLLVGGEEISVLEIPEGVKTIPSYAFYKCSNITGLQLPETLTNIETMAFYYCLALKSVSLPKNCSEMGTWAFAGCTALTGVELPYAFTDVPAYAFYGCTALEHVNLPTTLNSIGTAAFASCTSLEEIALPASLTNIGVNAFYETAITEAVVPSGVLSSSVFSEGAVTKVVLGSKVTEVGSYAFDSAAAVPSIVHSASKTAPKLDASAFPAYTAELYVPADSKSNYASGTWGKFSNVKHLLEPVDIQLSGQPDGSVEKDMTFTLEAMISPADVTIPYVVWTSSNPRLASVDNYGKVTVNADEDSDETSCEITAATLYAEGPVVTYTVRLAQDGISDVAVDMPLTVSNDIYTLQGVCIKRNATPDDIRALAPGLYIIAGKKHLVK